MAKIYQIATVLYDVLKTVVLPPSNVEPKVKLCMGGSGGLGNLSKWVRAETCWAG